MDQLGQLCYFSDEDVEARQIWEENPVLLTFGPVPYPRLSTIMIGAFKQGEYLDGCGEKCVIRHHCMEPWSNFLRNGLLT